MDKYDCHIKPIFLNLKGFAVTQGIEIVVSCLVSTEFKDVCKELI